ncbi:MAG: Holliday junction branch migration protein RuvA, partial [Gemmatimonadetes bacterium]|nr:Holliday junction branch migration protein RuvA [Gemmatimonadota bacterium]
SATIAQPQIPAGNSASGVAAEAVLALVALGIAESAASKAVAKARSTSDGEPSVQELIKRALRDR